MKFSNNVGDTSDFPTPLPACPYYVSFSRYSPLSLEVIENRTNVNVFGPQFFSGGTTPNFQRHIVRAAYRPPFDKVWLSYVC